MISLFSNHDVLSKPNHGLREGENTQFLLQVTSLKLQPHHYPPFKSRDEYKDWLDLQKGLSRGGNPGVYLSGRNRSEIDLGIPTILREKKAAGQDG